MTVAVGDGFQSDSGNFSRATSLSYAYADLNTLVEWSYAAPILYALLYAMGRAF